MTLQSLQQRLVAPNHPAAQKPNFIRLVFSLLLGLSLTLSAFASEAAPPLPANPLPAASLRGDFQSSSALGYTAFKTYMEHEGHPLAAVQNVPEDLNADDVLLLLDPTIPAEPNASQRRLIDGYLESPATMIVVAPKRVALETNALQNRLVTSALVDLGDAQRALNTLSGPDFLDRLENPEIELAWNVLPAARPLQVFQHIGAGWDVWIGSETNFVIVHGKRPNGAPIYFVSDPDIFANLGFAETSHATIVALLVQRVSKPGTRWFYDEHFHSLHSSYQPFYALLNPPGIAVSLSTLALLLLLAWFLLTRRGPTVLDEQVYPDIQLGISESFSSLMSQSLSSKELVEQFRASLLRQALGKVLAGDSLDEAAALAQLERLHPPSLSLASLDARLATFTRFTTHRSALRLAQAYHRWFLEVRDGTR